MSRGTSIFETASSHSWTQRLADGDAALDNAVAVSFVEDSGWWEPGKKDYLASWPSTLTVELNRQRGARA